MKALTRAVSLTLIANMVMIASLTAEDRVVRVERPSTEGTNAHYAGSRAPLATMPLIKLPVGTIKPRGWLHKQLELQSAGFHGHLGEISTFLRKDNNAWLSATGQGERGWEEVADYSLSWLEKVS